MTVFRNYRLRKELEGQLWRVNWNEIEGPIKPIGDTTDCADLPQTSEQDQQPDTPNTSANKLTPRFAHFIPSISPAFATKQAHKFRKKLTSNWKDKSFSNVKKLYLLS